MSDLLQKQHFSYYSNITQYQVIDIKLHPTAIFTEHETFGEVTAFKFYNQNEWSSSTSNLFVVD